MHLLKWLYPGMKFKRWLLLFSVGVMLVSLGLALVFNYKYLDLIEEAIFRAVYFWKGSYNYMFTTLGHRRRCRGHRPHAHRDALRHPLGHHGAVAG